jgi:hypothetical protein
MLCNDVLALDWPPSDRVCAEYFEYTNSNGHTTYVWREPLEWGKVELVITERPYGYWLTLAATSDTESEHCPGRIVTSVTYDKHAGFTAYSAAEAFVLDLKKDAGLSAQDILGRMWEFGSGSLPGAPHSE